ncbi:MAG: mannitol dehydrogenase family protein, partial [Microbacteriaceae bacterium]
MTPLTVPYDRAAVAPSIVHFGVGGFHRAHEAMYIDRLLRAGHSEWGICGVGVRPEDAAMRDALTAQNGLFTLVTVAPDGTEEAETIGSIVQYLFAPDDPGAVSRQLASPTTRIVSLTI